MTPATLEKIAEDAGGVRKFAQVLGVGKDWLYRRISGETPIERVDELAISKALEDNPTLS
jgi:hypothetical protein